MHGVDSLRSCSSVTTQHIAQYIDPYIHIRKLNRFMFLYNPVLYIITQFYKDEIDDG